MVKLLSRSASASNSKDRMDASPPATRLDQRLSRLCGFPLDKDVFVNTNHIRETAAGEFRKPIDLIVKAYQNIHKDCTCFQHDFTRKSIDFGESLRAHHSRVQNVCEVLADWLTGCKEIDPERQTSQQDQTDSTPVIDEILIECRHFQDLLEAANDILAIIVSFSGQMQTNQVAFEYALRMLHLKLLSMHEDVQLKAHVDEVKKRQIESSSYDRTIWLDLVGYVPQAFLSEKDVEYLKAVVENSNNRPNSAAILRLEGELLLDHLRSDRIVMDDAIAAIKSLEGYIRKIYEDLRAFYEAWKELQLHVSRSTFDGITPENLNQLLAVWDDIYEQVCQYGRDDAEDGDKANIFFSA